MKTPTTLIIMDGFALGEDIPGNAVQAAATPQLDYLWRPPALTWVCPKGRWETAR